MSNDQDFAQSLLDAGKGEQPPEGAAERVVERVAGGSAAMASVATGSLVAKSLWSVVGVAALAAAVGVATFVKHEPSTQAPGDPSSATLESPAPSVAVTASRTLASPTGTVARREPTSCERVELPDQAPTVCSKDGKLEALELVNTCADDVDLFWVDFKCRESFVARVAPGQEFHSSTYDAHPWRVRDHATHRLIKEWVGPAQPEPPKDPPRPEVVIGDGMSAAEGPPSQCSRFGNKAPIRFSNKRTSGVSIVFWVDYECHEEIYRRMEPGETWDQSTYDTHPWRVRDENGKLLVDYLPDGVDQTVYVSLP